MNGSVLGFALLAVKFALLLHLDALIFHFSDALHFLPNSAGFVCNDFSLGRTVI